jgi:TDG/mug DNA glycosylase family protein
VRRQAVRSVGFAPIAGNNTQVLVLGSLPGKRSLECKEYYAHPQNAFWRIMAELVGARGTYTARCLALMQHGIAVWDVLASSVRPGSLDSAIDLASAEINDFSRFFAEHPTVHRICCNGQAAARIFQRRVPQELVPAGAQVLTMPSTSPAYAAMQFSRKLELWRAGVGLTPGDRQD